MEGSPTRVEEVREKICLTFVSSCNFPTAPLFTGELKFSAGGYNQN